MLKRLITVCLMFISGVTFGQSAANDYINAYKEAAIRVMDEHGVPASIVLGIAIHESASGTSKIARYLNNHFGMKGSSGPKPIKSSYKGYESVDDSYEDFVTMLKNRSAFAKLFDKYNAGDYKGWLHGIQKGGYAQSQAWGTRVMAIIKKYHLYEFDNSRELAEQKPIKHVQTFTSLRRPAASKKPAATTSGTTKAAAGLEMKAYVVKKGDTLDGIARKFETSATSIKSKNGLKTAYVEPGQELLL